MKSTPKVRIVSATEAKNKFGEIIKHAYASDQHLIVEKSGIPVVAIIPMADYQQLVGLSHATADIAKQVSDEARRAEARKDLAEFLKRVHAEIPKVDEDDEEAERFIQQEVDAMRAERAKKTLAESRAKFSTRTQRRPKTRAKK